MPNHFETFKKIQKLILSSRFNEAFMLLKNNLAIYPSLESLLVQINSTESRYKYLLDYLAEGHNDPNLNDMIESTRETLFHANTLLLRELNLKDSSDIYSSTRRMIELKKITLDSLFNNLKKILFEEPETSHLTDSKLISKKQWEIIKDIFNYVWTIGNIGVSDGEKLIEIFNDQTLPEYLKAIIVSAITLANISYFDQKSLDILLNVYETSESITIKARAITGVVLACLCNSNRLQGNLQLRSRLIISSEDANLKNQVNEVVIGIIKTYDTTRIDKKMRDEVIPGLMKIQPEIIDKMRNLSSDSENFLSEGNPEWENLLENSDLGDKLREINDLQLEGADVMVTAFSSLKSYPFFAEVANWFLPFSPNYFEFDSLNFLSDKGLIENLSSVMCDSDVHSFLISMKSMPEENRERMMSQIQLQMKEAREVLSNTLVETESLKLRKKIKQTLQDLYRFFKFYHKNKEFEDPFAKPFLSQDIKPLISVFGIESSLVQLIAEFYFKYKYYSEARGFLELSDSLSSGNFNLWEKIGFCYDKIQEPQKAVEWYTKANIINPGNQWLIKKLALSLKNSGNYTDASFNYQKALDNEPDNYHLLMSYGECLLSIGKYQEALQQFYHARYLNPEKKEVLRALAWTELFIGNFEKANSFYDMLLSDSEKNKTDYLNAGHSALASGDFKKALNLYSSFISICQNKDITDLVIAFRDDAETLKKLGIKTSDLRLIIDKIRYNYTS